MTWSLLAALVRISFAQENIDPQSLNATLSGNERLSNSTTFLGLVPELLNSLSNAPNITILALSNEAFTGLANSGLSEAYANDPELLAAVLQYHVLNGTFTSNQISNTSTFIPTFLQNQIYSNVTGGQVVEAIMIDNDTIFYSELLQNTTVSQTVC
jgi:uncharacterized surface protein with fasciclin (FAS1) repeats